MDLQVLLASLRNSTTTNEITAILQTVVRQLLNEAYFEVADCRCFPLELESYFYRREIFEDPYVHDNELQRNHFGELYVHRLGRLVDSPYKMDNRVCVGICLSDSDEYFYSALIRSAQWTDGTRIFGPNNVLTHWVRQINQRLKILDDSLFDQLRPGGRDLQPLLPHMEGTTVLGTCTPEVNDPRDHTTTIFAERVGLGGQTPTFRMLPLRGITGTLRSAFRWKDKTTLLHSYLADKNLHGEAACEASRELYGSVPQWVKALSKD